LGGFSVAVVRSERTLLSLQASLLALRPARAAADDTGGDVVRMCAGTALEGLDPTNLLRLRAALSNRQGDMRALEAALPKYPLSVPAAAEASSAVTVEQLVRDYERDVVTVCGVRLRGEGAHDRVRDVLREAVQRVRPDMDADAVAGIARGIMKVGSRTASGADSFFAVRAAVGPDAVVTPHADDVDAVVVSAQADGARDAVETPAPDSTSGPMRNDIVMDILPDGRVAVTAYNTYAVWARTGDDLQRQWILQTVLSDVGSLRNAAPRARTLAIQPLPLS
jgi:hypothetical protein